VYPNGRPLYTPDEFYTILDAIESSNLATKTKVASRAWFSCSSSSDSSTEPIDESVQTLPFAPFPNISIFRLMSWYYGASNSKSLGELNCLVNDVILAHNFSKEDFIGFHAAKEANRMDASHPLLNPEETTSPSFKLCNDGWIETSVIISLPCDGVKHTSEADAPKFKVKGLYYRRITEVIRSTLSEPAAEKFHLFPFKTFWKPSPSQPEEHIYSEAYTANYFLQEYEKTLRQRPANQTNSHRIPVVLGIMLWSDSTHLANFGTASLWPIYLYFANQSKYTRAKTSDFAAHHCYVP